MTNRFTVNGVIYTAAAFDFNTVCDLEEMGVSLDKAQRKKPFSLVRAYFAVCADMDVDDAGKELEKHIVNGGSLDDLMNAMNKEMEESDFFRNASKTAETEATADEGEETAEKK